MRNKRLLWVVLALAAAAFAVFACGIFKKEKPAETPITVTEKPAEAPPTEAPTEPAPAPLPYTPKTLDNLKMLDDCLGASEKTLGWDNVYCSLSLEKDVELFTTIQGSYAPGSADRSFIDASITDLTNIGTFLDEKITKAEGVDPTGAEAKAKKKKIADIRARVRAMISGPTPPKEPVPEWKGDLMKKKWKEGGDLKKKKWAERGKK